MDTKRSSITREHEIIPTNNDAVPIRRATYEGFEVDVTLARQDSTFDQLVDTLQQGYFGGAVPPVVTMYETIRNPNNTADQYQYTGGVILPEGLGGFKGADPVNDMTLKIKFSFRQLVSAGAVTSQTAPTTFG
jgi:hypothetical protein